MAWRDDYRPGSFRGVPFHLKSSSSTGGRRTVLNEFPLRDTPMTEDMGRRARQFQLNLTLIGQDYMAQRDRLIAALETAGPGTLVHPFRGELQVAVLGDYSCEESTEQGGLARISVIFVESGETPRPDSLKVQGNAANAAADALQADAAAEFEAAFSVAGFASFVAEGALDSLQAATRAVYSAGGLLQGAGTFGTLYSQLTGSLQQLILSPGNLAGSLLGLVRGLAGGFSNPLQALAAQMSLFGLGKRAKAVAGSSVYLTPARAQVQANQKAVYRLIERAAVAEAVRLAVSKPASSSASSSPAATTTTSSTSVTASGASSTAGTPQRVAGIAYDNRDQAVEIRDQLLEELDRQQLDASAEHYRPLAMLATELVRELNRTAANLVPLTRVTPAVTMPALLLAHRLYGDARQAEQIVTRNRLSHPGFVSGGVELEVLKNA
ncbi:MAG: DNA circularization N-terminal domain-containing protein [Pseudomonas sp.]|nr:DNA circularization N-terminal domain-containing protein [Pseudomonas sp.]